MKARCFLFLIISSLFTFQVFAQELSINVLNFTRANSTDKTRVSEALRLVGKVMNSDEFRNQILDMEYSLSGKVYSGYTQTKMSPDEVLESVLRAEENFEGGKTGSMDLYMDMYYKKCTPWSCVVGYTSPKDPYFHMNRYLHQNYSPAQTAGNIVHEWLHKIGHGHTQENNVERPHSVPYKLGYLIATMTAQLASEEDPLKANMFVEDFTNMLEQPCSH